MATLYTIGHSTRALEDFIALLKAHEIERLVDIRAFPGSRRLPHFNREALEKSLTAQSIEYLWMPELGGRRHKKNHTKDSPNVGLRNQSFRNYADYMLTPEFHAAAAKLEQLAAEKPTAIMCAEAVFFRCHRMLVSDFFTLHGHSVLHIQDPRPPRPHRLTPEARLVGDDVIYQGDRLL
jgi:uncharacterized protein (DUF488 family)